MAGLEGNLKMLSSELGAARTSHRKAENTWCGERSVLVRKLQFLEKYGTLEGTHSEHRARERRGGKEKPIIVERLEEEGRERQKELDKTRQQLLRVRKIISIIHVKSCLSTTSKCNFHNISNLKSCLH